MSHQLPYSERHPNAAPPPTPLVPAHEHHLVQHANAAAGLPPAHAHVQRMPPWHAPAARIPAPARRPTVPAYHPSTQPAAATRVARPLAPMYGPGDDAAFRFTAMHALIGVTLVILALVMSQGADKSPSVQTLGPLSSPIVGPQAPDSATLPMRRPGSVGIPLPAAAASAADERRTSGTSSPRPLQLKGMPSPAAAATLGPQTLPMVSDTDGMTLPNGAMERDSYGNDSHYLTLGSAPSEALREATLPLRTPGAAAADAERHARDYMDPSSVPYAGGDATRY